MNAQSQIAAKTAIDPENFALANCLRALAIDAVNAANSGHPGAPMGMADIAEVLTPEQRALAKDKIGDRMGRHWGRHSE